jgi:hypothetical protein
LVRYVLSRDMLSRMNPTLVKSTRLAVILVFVGSSLGVTASNPPPLRLLPPALIGPYERGEYIARDARTHEELWRTRWVVERVTANGRDLVHVREDGAGRRGRPEPTQWTVSMEVDLTNGNERFSAVREIRDLSERPLETQRRTISYKAGSGSVTTIDHDKHAEQSVTFSVDDQSIPTELLSTQLRALADAPGRHMRFRLITRDGKAVPMAARIVGHETVTTPAGAFDCYKTELTVSGLQGVVGQLVLPAMHMWHSVDPPHVWVKYQGLDGGVGSRRVVMELARFETRMKR